MSDDITPSKLHRLYVTNDKYDYAMAMAGACHRLAYTQQCGCPHDECTILNMYVKWADENGNR
jgi:hypothetical protein